MKLLQTSLLGEKMKKRFLNFGILLALMFIFILSNCSLIEPNLTDEQVDLELSKVSQQISSKPDWLSLDEQFSSEIVPASSKELNYSVADCRNNPNRCFEECKKEDGNSCYALALLFENRNASKQNGSMPIFLRACKFGIMSGCTNYAAGILNSDPKNIDIIQTAKRIFEQTCETKDAWGCAMYGMLLGESAESDEELNNAVKYLSKACEFVSIEHEACKNAQTIIEQINKTKSKEKPKK